MEFSRESTAAVVLTVGLGLVTAGCSGSGPERAPGTSTSQAVPHGGEGPAPGASNGTEPGTTINSAAPEARPEPIEIFRCAIRPASPEIQECTYDANQRTAFTQAIIGERAVVAAMDQPVAVTMNGKPYRLNFEFPSAEALRAKVIYTGRAAESGRIFSQLGIKKGADATTSKTVFGVVPAKGGGFTLAGQPQTVSVVGQDVANGMVHRGPATEACQRLDMRTSPATTTTDQYLALKEGGCNVLGFAADAAFNHESYAPYAQSVDGQPMDKQISHGQQVAYRPISDKAFNLLFSPSEG
jgi:hypothetical protein